jgi:hypothetical protein
MTTIETPRPDLAAVKARQQQAWASGDYAAVAARIVLIAERPSPTPPTYGPVRQCLTWPPAAATPRWRPPAAAVR